MPERKLVRCTVRLELNGCNIIAHGPNFLAQIQSSACG
jgi:hypothetical protein